MKRIRRRTWCPICTKDHDVILSGPVERFYVCKVCTQGFVLRKDQKEVCPHCGSMKWESIADFHPPKRGNASHRSEKVSRVPLVCLDCQQRFQDYRDAIDAGGLYIVCSSCGHLGYVVGGSLASHYRKLMNTPKGPGVILGDSLCSSCMEASPGAQGLPIPAFSVERSVSKSEFIELLSRLFPVQKIEAAPGPVTGKPIVGPRPPEDVDNVVDFVAFKNKKEAQ